jgi:hypothetical protein
METNEKLEEENKKLLEEMEEIQNDQGANGGLNNFADSNDYQNMGDHKGDNDEYSRRNRNRIGSFGAQDPDDELNRRPSIQAE